MEAENAIAERPRGREHKQIFTHSILFVDDEPGVLKALKRLFIDEPYKVVIAESGEAALDLMEQNRINLVVSDYSMPGLSGIDFLKMIKTRHPETIRIMLTAHADTAVVMGAVKDGSVYKFITKPWNDDDLKLTVKLALAQYDLHRENLELKKVTKKQFSELKKLRHFAGMDHSPLGNVLLTQGLLLADQLEVVDRYRKQNNSILIKALIELGLCDGKELLRVIQDASKAEYAHLKLQDLDRELVKLLPREICETGCLVPFKTENKSVYLAMADPLDLERIEFIEFTTQKNVIPMLAGLGEIEKAIKYLYSEDDTIAGQPRKKSAEEIEPAVEDGEEIALLLDDDNIDTPEQLIAKSSSPSAITMVNTIISQAIKQGASDIHIEPKPQHTLVRFRIDGILHDKFTLPPNLQLSTISRLKIIAKMDIAERRVPQDGRFAVKSDDRLVDLRVSTMPTINGEKMVLRLLDKSAKIMSLAEIGLRGKSLDRLENVINVPQGMIIGTGPTGSGKTTSLYSMMKKRLTSTENFVTIEDPVEYLMERASQVHIFSKIGLTFASSLRATLRQDPDVILVGEIRDLETAKAAFQAAMTGHLVFTSLHTNSTVATISRLFHLGVEPYLVASAVNGIFAQRLVRRICPHCRELKPVDKNLQEALGLGQRAFPEKLYYGRGCNKCDKTGYLGRIGLFEVFQMNEEFRHFLTADYKESKLLSMAKSMGMETLLDDGVGKVLDGLTTLEEILRVQGPAVKYEYVCKNCCRPLDIKFVICPYCGTRQKKLCRYCHYQLEDNWVACPYCGQS